MQSADHEGCEDLEALATSLESCQNYKVLRRIPAPVVDTGARGDKFALIVDTETTGLGFGLIDHIQKMTMAAMAIADMKVWAQRSYRV